MRHLKRIVPTGALLGLLAFAASAGGQAVLTPHQAMQQIANSVIAAGYALPTTTTVPTNTTAAPTTTQAPTTTVTTVPATTTTQPGPEGSYVNPVNTGNKASGLTVINGNRTYNTDTTLSNLRINGRVLVTGGARVTLNNVTVAPTNSSSTAAVSVRDGAHLNINHFTIVHAGSACSNRGLEAQGGTFTATFADISGTEDGVNLSTSPNAGLISLVDSWVHDLKRCASSSPHHDGIQIMGGDVLILRSVFDDIEPSTAAIFPKPDFHDVTLVVRNSYASGGGYTIYAAEGCGGGQYCGGRDHDVEVWWDNVELNADNSRWGAVLGARRGGVSHELGLGYFEVDYQVGEPGFHPGPQGGE